MKKLLSVLILSGMISFSGAMTSFAGTLTLSTKGVSVDTTQEQNTAKNNADLVKSKITKNTNKAVSDVNSVKTNVKNTVNKTVTDVNTLQTTTKTTVKNQKELAKKNVKQRQQAMQDFSNSLQIQN